MDEQVNREVRRIVRRQLDMIGGKPVFKGIRCRAWSQTWDSVTAFEETAKPCGDGALGFSETPDDPNKPPLLIDKEYIQGKIWTGADGNQWRFNQKTHKWVNVSGPVERGRNAQN